MKYNQVYIQQNNSSLTYGNTKLNYTDTIQSYIRQEAITKNIEEKIGVI